MTGTLYNKLRHQLRDIDGGGKLISTLTIFPERDGLGLHYTNPDRVK